MPDEFKPKAPLALAKPGQVPGFGRLIRKDELQPDYAKASVLAYANPGVPVIVHEWAIPTDEDKRKKLYQHIAEEVRITLPLMNAADAAKELVIDHSATTALPPPAEGVERFQVSLTAKADDAYRTYVVFWQNGRPIRRRSERSDGADDASAEHAEVQGQEARLEAPVECLDPTPEPPPPPPRAKATIERDKAEAARALGHTHDGEEFEPTGEAVEHGGGPVT
jgi:hypothetical protein